jgi:hypothetical protein
VFDCCTNPSTETPANFSQCMFYQIPSSRMVTTKPVGSLEEMLSLSGSDPMILQMDVLNSELENFKSIIAEVEIEYEDFEDEDKDDDSVADLDDLDNF